MLRFFGRRYTGPKLTDTSYLRCVIFSPPQCCVFSCLWDIRSFHNTRVLICLRPIHSLQTTCVFLCFRTIRSLRNTRVFSCLWAIRSLRDARVFCCFHAIRRFPYRPAPKSSAAIKAGSLPYHSSNYVAGSVLNGGLVERYPSGVPQQRGR